MDVKEKGAVPIVLSHTPRNKFDNGEIERNTSSLVNGRVKRQKRPGLIL